MRVRERAKKESESSQLGALARLSDPCDEVSRRFCIGNASSNDPIRYGERSSREPLFDSSVCRSLVAPFFSNLKEKKTHLSQFPFKNKHSLFLSSSQAASSSTMTARATSTSARRTTGRWPLTAPSTEARASSRRKVNTFFFLLLPFRRRRPRPFFITTSVSLTHILKLSLSISFSSSKK